MEKKKSLVNVVFTPYKGCQIDYRELIVTVAGMYPKVLKELSPVIKRLLCPASTLQAVVAEGLKDSQKCYIHLPQGGKPRKH